MPYYKNPKTGPVAMLGSLQSDSLKKITGIFIFKNAAQCKGLLKLNNLLTNINNKPVPISANRLVTLMVSVDKFGYMPDLFIFSFYPKQNMRYYIDAKAQYKNGVGSYVVRLLRENRTGSYRPVTVTQRRLKPVRFVDYQDYQCQKNYSKGLPTAIELKNSMDGVSSEGVIFL